MFPVRPSGVGPKLEGPGSGVVACPPAFCGRGPGIQRFRIELRETFENGSDEIDIRGSCDACRVEGLRGFPVTPSKFLFPRWCRSGVVRFRLRFFEIATGGENGLHRQETGERNPPPVRRRRANFLSIGLLLEVEHESKLMPVMLKPLQLGENFGCLPASILKTIGRVDQEICVGLFLFLGHLRRDSFFRVDPAEVVTRHQALQL